MIILMYRYIYLYIDTFCLYIYIYPILSYPIPSSEYQRNIIISLLGCVGSVMMTSEQVRQRPLQFRAKPKANQ